MVESKAYFVAFKHVLEALQNIKSVPLPHYILDVTNDSYLPSYLNRHQPFVFDLSILSSSSLMVREEAVGAFMFHKYRRNYDEEEVAPRQLLQVYVPAPLSSWPNSSFFNFNISNMILSKL